MRASRAGCVSHVAMLKVQNRADSIDIAGQETTMPDVGGFSDFKGENNVSGYRVS